MDRRGCELVCLLVFCVAGTAGYLIKHERPWGTQPGCDVCEWSVRAHRFQRRLADNVSVASTVFHGSHNSFNWRDASGLPIEYPHNNWFSMTEQLDMLSARYLEMDPHYLESWQNESLGMDSIYRVKDCHMGRGAAESLFTLCPQIDWLMCKAFGIDNLGNDTGCSVDAPAFVDDLIEVREWLDRDNNDEEFLTIFFDEFLDNQVALFDAVVEAAGLDAYVYRPITYKLRNGLTNIEQSHLQDPSTWPTVEELRNEESKAVIMFMNGGLSQYTFDNELARKRANIRDFREDWLPNSTMCPSPPPLRSFHYIQGDVTKYSLFGFALDNSIEAENVVSLQDVEDGWRCGFGTYFDAMDVNDAAAMVWSWDRFFPEDDDTKPCAKSGANDRFTNVACAAPLRYACQRTSNTLDWVLSSSTFAGDATGITPCPAGYKWSVPHTYAEAYALKHRKAQDGVDEVWLNYRLARVGQQYCWRDERPGSSPVCYDGPDPTQVCRREVCNNAQTFEAFERSDRDDDDASKQDEETVYHQQVGEAVAGAVMHTANKLISVVV